MGVDAQSDRDYVEYHVSRNAAETSVVSFSEAETVHPIRGTEEEQKPETLDDIAGKEVAEDRYSRRQLR